MSEPPRHLGFLDSEIPELHAMSSQDYFDFEVILDSGAAEHVIGGGDIKGYEVLESAGSKAGACFVAANGERIPNRGEVKLQLKSGDVPIQSTFQVSTIHKPLWSVGKLCDAGYHAVFRKTKASVFHTATGRSVGTFQRRHGLYVGALKLRNPATLFSRQGR